MKNVLKTFILCAVVLSFSFFFSNSSSAQISAPKECPKGVYCLSVPIPGAPTTEITGPAQYIKYLYQFGLGIGALLAIAIIVFAGIKYSVSAGNVAQQEDARDMIKNAILGLALLLGAVLIMYTINPNLVRLGALENAMDAPKIKPPLPSKDGSSLLDKPIGELSQLLRTTEKDCRAKREALLASKEGSIGEDIVRSTFPTLSYGYDKLKELFSEEEIQTLKALTDCDQKAAAIGRIISIKKAGEVAQSLKNIDRVTLLGRYEKDVLLLEKLIRDLQSAPPEDATPQEIENFRRETQAAINSLQREIGQIDEEIKRQDALKK